MIIKGLFHETIPAEVQLLVFRNDNLVLEFCLYFLLHFLEKKAPKYFYNNNQVKRSKRFRNLSVGRYNGSCSTPEMYIVIKYNLHSRSLADPRGRRRHVPTPPTGSNSFVLLKILPKSAHIRGQCRPMSRCPPPQREILDPPLSMNCD